MQARQTATLRFLAALFVLAAWGWSSVATAQAAGEPSLSGASLSPDSGTGHGTAGPPPLLKAVP